jgi:membrane protease YdiL (CAAX protease family)
LFAGPLPVTRQFFGLAGGPYDESCLPLVCRSFRIHFYWDASDRSRARLALEQIIFRIAICLAIGFVLSWLTNRSESLLPPVLAHWLYNLLLAIAHV